MDSKKWFLSKTVWSNILVVLVAAITAVDAQFATGIMSNGITVVALSVLGSLGIYGRITAKTEIK